MGAAPHWVKTIRFVLQWAPDCLLELYPRTDRDQEPCACPTSRGLSPKTDPMVKGQQTSLIQCQALVAGCHGHGHLVPPVNRHLVPPNSWHEHLAPPINGHLVLPYNGHMYPVPPINGHSHTIPPINRHGHPVPPINGHGHIVPPVMGMGTGQ